MATIYRVGRSWYIQWTEQGKRYRRSLGKISDDDARTVLQIEEARLTDRKLTGRKLKPHSSITLEQFAPDYLAWRASEYPASQARVTEAIKNHLIPAFGAIPMQDLTPWEIERFKTARRAEKAAPATIKKELDTLKAAFNKAVAWELIPAHRIASVSPPKALRSRPPRYYTKDELEAIYANATQYGALWRFMANTGIRRAEVLQARRRHIVDGVIRILSNEGSRTKSAKWRPVPLSPGALGALVGLGDDYLAPRIYPQSLSRAFKKDAGKIGGSIHCLRHTFCSHLVMAGIPLRTVQELAGHASYETTLRYAHLSKSHLQDAVMDLEI